MTTAAAFVLGWWGGTAWVLLGVWLGGVRHSTVTRRAGGEG